MRFQNSSYLLAIVIFFGLAFSPMLGSKVFYTPEQARQLAFPDADRIEKRSYVLTRAQAEAVERLSRTTLDSKLVRLQTAWRGETLLGYFQIDVHNVRTKPEALLIVLDAQGRVAQVRVLAFHEPLDYKPVQRWYDGFVGKKSGDSLRVGFDVDAVSGATLTTRATTSAVRRVLAYHEVLFSD